MSSETQTLLTLLSSKEITVQISSYDLRTGSVKSEGTSGRYPIASLYKFIFLLKAISEWPESFWKETLIIEPREQAGGYGVLRGLPDPVSTTFGNLAYLMMFTSDGTAAELLFNSPRSFRRIETPISFGNDTLITLQHSEMVESANGAWSHIMTASNEAEADDLKRKFVSNSESIGGYTNASDFVVIIASLVNKVIKNPFFVEMTRDTPMKPLRSSKRMFGKISQTKHWVGKTGTLGFGHVMNDSGILFEDGTPSKVVAVTSYGWKSSNEESEQKLADLFATFTR